MSGHITPWKHNMVCMTLLGKNEIQFKNSSSYWFAQDFIYTTEFKAKKNTTHGRMLYQPIYLFTDECILIRLKNKKNNKIIKDVYTI